MRPGVGVWGLAAVAMAVTGVGTVGPMPARASSEAPASVSSEALAQQTTFTEHVAPILFEHCSRCHRPGGLAPFSLLTYSAARQRASEIAAVTKNRTMPPWQVEPGYGDFVGLQLLTDTEIDLIQRWVVEGRVEGDPGSVPPLPAWTAGWQLGEPDLVVSVPQAFTVRAEGPDVFRTFVLPLPIDAARHVKGLEFRPGNRRVVHHANIYIDRTRRSRVLDEQDPAPGYEGLLPGSAGFPAGHFLGWTPGQVDDLLPEDISWRLDPGTDLVLSLHLQTTGSEEAVRPSVGFFWSDAAPERTPTLLRLGRQDHDIAPGERHYTITDSYTLPVDVDVLMVKPHAHFRAREMQGFATLPDGTTSWLIYIEEWDFNWQHYFRYVTPLALPRGTVLQMRYTYDNSADNQRNPVSPPVRVRWGPESLDEMGDLWIQALTRDEPDRVVLNREFRAKAAAEEAVGYEVLIERDPENAALRDDVAMLYLELGRPAEAVGHFEASVRLKPDSAASYFNLGAALMFAGRSEEAGSQYRRVLRIDPDHVGAHNNLGSLLEARGDLDAALEHYREALRLQPRYARAHNNAGSVLMRLGTLDAALVHLREALRLDPRLPEASHNIGLLLQSRGELAEAIRRYREALALRPDWPPVLADLAWVLATASDDRLWEPQEAVRLAERAADLTGRRHGRTLDVLGAAYAATGLFDRALQAVEAALRLTDGSPETRRGLLERQQLYQNHQPYRQPAGP